MKINKANEVREEEKVYISIHNQSSTSVYYLIKIQLRFKFPYYEIIAYIFFLSMTTNSSLASSFSKASSSSMLFAGKNLSINSSSSVVKSPRKINDFASVCKFFSIETTLAVKLFKDLSNRI